MMAHMDISQWYSDAVGDDSANAVAMKAGILQSTLARQLQRGTLSPEVVAAIGRAYRADILAGFVACGLLEQEEVDAIGARFNLSQATDVEIADEVYRRLTRRESEELVEPLQFPSAPQIKGMAAREAELKGKKLHDHLDNLDN